MELLSKQRKYFASGVTRKQSFREAQLKKLQALVKEHQADVSAALAKDLGKSEAEALLTEYGFSLFGIDHILKNLGRWMQDQEVPTGLTSQPAKSYIRREPLGTALIMSPWNYPFELAISPVAAAVAAGNTIILKPSELTPNVSMLLAKMLNENFDEGFLRVIEGGPEVATELLAQRFDKIFFTGSPRVGKIVAKAAAENLTSVTLELGGKSPAIVLVDADISISARRLAWGKCLNAGQTCVAPDYVLVHRSVKQKLIAEMKSCLVGFYPEGPKPGRDFTRIVNEQNFDRLVGLLQGANILYGGKTDRAERFIEPTLLDQVSWNSPIMQQEIFGPILPILEFEDLDEAINGVLQYEKPLALYVFTKDEYLKEKVLNSISFGGGTVNDTIMHLANPELPFGGVGHSGQGSYHGEAGFLTFSHSKSIMERSTWVDPDLRYPPYTEGKMKWVRRLL